MRPSGAMMRPTLAMPTISAIRPTRTIVTGEMRPDVAPANPLATNDPIASDSSRKPVCRASKPRTNWSHSGRVRMMPNSPSETTIAAMLPLRNDAMRSRANSSSTDLPVRLRRRSQRMKPTSARAETANAIGTGESSNGHVKSPIWSAVSVSHQP